MEVHVKLPASVLCVANISLGQKVHAALNHDLQGSMPHMPIQQASY